MVLNYTRTELKKGEQSKQAISVDFSTLNKQKKHEINKIIARLLNQNDQQ